MAECLQKYLYASFNLKMQSFGRSIIYVAPLQWSRQSYYATCLLKRGIKFFCSSRQSYNSIIQLNIQSLYLKCLKFMFIKIS